jgi:hypothetical protein
MRLRTLGPVHRDRPLATRPRPLTADWDLNLIILRMIATQSLAAFTPAIGRAEPVRGLSPAAGAAARADQSAAAQKPLEMVPPQPGRPMPRGSLLDLRV